MTERVRAVFYAGQITKNVRSVRNPWTVVDSFGPSGNRRQKSVRPADKRTESGGAGVFEWSFGGL